MSNITMKKGEDFLLILSLLNLIFTWFCLSLGRDFQIIYLILIFIFLLALTLIFYKRLKKGDNKSAWFFLFLGFTFLIFSVPLFSFLFNVNFIFPGLNFVMLFIIWLPFLGVTIGILRQSYDLLKNKHIEQTIEDNNLSQNK